MKISYTWLKKYLYIKSNPDIHFIANILSNIGFEVKSIIKNNTLDIDVTSDKVHLVNHYTIAHILFVKLTIMKYDVIFKENNSEIIKLNQNISSKIIIKDKKNCNRYIGIIIPNIKITQYKSYIKQELNNIENESVNNITDILKFIQHDIGVHINIYDADKICAQEIHIKKINSSTKFPITKNKCINIHNKETLIFDKYKPISIPGLINNANTKINNDTKNIFLEIINFNQEIIKKNAVRYNISSNYNFKNTQQIIDDEQLYTVINKIYDLFQLNKLNYKLNIIDLNQTNYKKKIIVIYYQNIDNIIGQKINNKIIIDILILSKIKILVKNKKYIKILIPVYRHDIKKEIDVINEIIKIYGYENIQTNNNINIHFNINQINKKNVFYDIENKIINYLTNNGFYQTISIPFNKKNYFNDDITKKNIEIINPANKNFKLLRSNILENIIEHIKFNILINNIFLNFFEIGNIFYKKKNRFYETKNLTIVMTEYNIKNIFFYLKNITYNILQLFGVKNIFNINQYIINHNNLKLKILDKTIAKIGLINKEILNHYNITKQNIYFSSINLKYLYELHIKQINNKIIINNKINTKDISLLIKNEVLFEDIKKMIHKMKIKYIKNMELIDKYVGNNIPNNYKSYTLRLYFHYKTPCNKNTSNIILKNIINTLEKNKFVQVRQNLKVVPAGLEPATS